MTIPTRSLSWKLVACFVGVIALAITIVSVYVGFTVRQRFDLFVLNTLARQADTLSIRVARAHELAGGQWTAVGGLVTTTSSLAHSDVWVVDAHGTVQASASESGQQLPAPSDAAMSAALRGKTSKAMQTNGLFGPRRASAAAPIMRGKRIIGAVYLSLSPSETIRRAPNEQFLLDVNRRIVVGGIVAGVLAAIIGAALARSVTRPLREITGAVEQIARGDYGQRVVVRSSDEVGQLAFACNRMAAELERDVGELRRQEELRSDLVANVSHDLSTPLTAIQGFTEAMMDGVIKGDEERRETLQTVYAEVLRLRRLVDDLKNLTQLQGGAVAIAPQPLILAPLVQEILYVEQAGARERGVTLHQEVPDDLPTVEADGDRIGQILLNLVDNALRHTTEGGTITVSAETDGTTVWVHVSDSGDGIPTTQLPHIFERFYRVDSSRSATTGGSGLGLAIVKAIVEAHGGTVAASSTVGQGTRLSFSLPVRTRPVDKQARKVVDAVAVAHGHG